jgi:hypothetical protein
MNTVTRGTSRGGFALALVILILIGVLSFSLGAYSLEQPDVATVVKG